MLLDLPHFPLLLQVQGGFCTVVIYEIGSERETGSIKVTKMRLLRSVTQQISDFECSCRTYSLLPILYLKDYPGLKRNTYALADIPRCATPAC